MACALRILKRNNTNCLNPIEFAIFPIITLLFVTVTEKLRFNLNDLYMHFHE